MLSNGHGYEGRTVAFMDIGTNSVRLLLVRLNPNNSFTILSDQKEIVRLGEGEFVDQHLHPEAMQRAVLVVNKFTEMARAYGVEEVTAVATSATREAENRDEFIRRLKREAQLELRVVSGKEEARLIYLGVSSGVHLAGQQVLFIDIGGGSTEVIVGSQQEYAFLDSLKLGAIRLTSLFFLPTETGRVPPERYALIQQYVRNLAVRTVQAIQALPPVSIAIGSSGTIENLADVAAWMFLGRRRERDDSFTHTQLKKTIAALCDLPLEDRRRIQGINPARADIIIAGAAILDTLMQDLGIEKIRISDRGLRDGLLVDYLSRSEQGKLLEGMSVRERSVLQLARACGVDEGHAQEVVRLSLELYDSARQAGLHKFGEPERELLGYAAMLHDVGIFLSYNNHEQHSYYMIRNADLLGFDQTEIAIMANAGLFHRKSMPRKKKNPSFGTLDKRSQRLVQLLTILLRIAESLDRSHTGAVQHAQFRQGEDRQIILDICASRDCPLELWGVLTHRDAFQDILGKKLETCVVIENSEI
jgi:exopolyphosphatase/guanosine-5'-triphosphate,3'-diphosphate pyrophosphatase